MRKKFGLIFTFLLVTVLAVTAFGCTGSDVDYSRIEKITVNEISIADGFYVGDFDVSKIILDVKYFDTELNGNTVAGEVVQLPVEMSMIKAEDKAKLSIAGTHTITIIYGKFEISCTIVLFDTNVVRYRVVFTDEDGTVLPVINGTLNGNSQFVEAGGRAIAPTLPTKPGYSFMGWKDRDTGSMSSYDNISKDVTFVAVYAKDLYSVSYYTRINGEEKEIGKADVPRGGNALSYAPEIPIVVGYSNGRWENENAMKNVNSDGLKFYAIYDNDQVVVGFIYKRFSANDENYSTLYDVGSEILNPPAAEISDFKFVEWRVNGKKATFPYTVTSETVFTAYYIPVSVGNAGLEYTISGADTVTVTGYDGAERVVVIPENVVISGDVYDVTEIKDGIFAGFDIDEYVVSNTNLNFITENGVLYDRNKTELIAYPSARSNASFNIIGTVTSIRPYAFYGAKISGVTLNDALTTIGKRAFSECSDLASVAIPKGVTTISDFAFAMTDGGSLASVTFANNSALTEIGKGAFEGADKLTTIALPSSLTTLGAGAFAGCKSLSTVTAVNSSSFIVDNGVLYSVDYDTLYLYPALYQNAVNSNYEVSSFCRRIATGAFSYARITGITVVNEQMTLEDNAVNCPGLINFRTHYNTLNFGATSFGNNVPSNFFVPSGADALRDEIVDTYSGSACYFYEDMPYTTEDYFAGFAYEPCVISVLNNGEYEQKEGVRILGAKFAESTIEFPTTLNNSNVIAIGDKAFYGNIDVENVFLPAGLLVVGDEAFYGCKNLKFVSFGNLTDTVGDRVFADCTSLTQVVAPSDMTSVTEFGEDVFLNTPYYDISGELFLAFGNVLIGYNGYATKVTVPSSVTYIAGDAFSGKGEITELSFEGRALKKVDSYAFQYCTGLQEITFPSSITEVRTNAFFGCDKLFAVTYGVNSDDSALQIHSGAYHSGVIEVFLDTPKYNLIYFVDGTDSGTSETYSGAVAINPYKVENTARIRFAGWFTENTFEHLASFPMKITGETRLYAKNIDVKASSDGLIYGYDDKTDSYIVEGYNGTDEYVIVPASYKNRYVRYIGAEAFKNKNVKYIELPYSKNVDGSISSDIIGIGEDAFAGTPWYNNYNGDFVMIDDILVKYKGNSDVVYLPDGVNVIAEGAFRGNTDVKKVIIPDGVSAISRNAFYDCTGLTSVDLPVGLTSIDYKAFYGCSSLEKINFSDCEMLGSVGYDAFEGTYWLDHYAADCVMINDILYRYNQSAAVTSLHIYNGVVTIGERAFYHNETLQTVYIPQSVRYIGESAFEGGNVTNVVLFAGGSELNYIGDAAFKDCNKLATIDLSLASDLAEIGERAFSGCSVLREINIPAALKTLGKYAFSSSGLKNVVFATGSKLASISEGAFKECGSLFAVTFSGTSALIEIGVEAFYNCTSLRDFNNERGVLVRIKDKAFYNCANLRNFTVNSATLKEIGDLALYNVGYVTASSNQNMVVLGNILIKYNGSEPIVTIPSNVTSIYNGAFAGNTRIKEVVFPSDSAVININSNAFAGCSNLAAINFPDTVKYVGDDVVTGTEWLSTRIRNGEELIIIANTLIKYNYSSLKQVVLPEYVETINAGAFEGAAVYDIVIGANLSTIKDGAFDGIDVSGSSPYPNWTITIERELPPTLEYADLSEITASKIIMPSDEVLDGYRMDIVWGELIAKMEVPNRVTVVFVVDEEKGYQVSPIHNVNAIYAEIPARAKSVDGTTYIFMGWYEDELFIDKVVYPFMIDDNCTELTLYAKFVDNNEGSNPERYSCSFQGETGTIDLYNFVTDGSGNVNVSDAKIVVIGRMSDKDLVRIGQGYVIDEDGYYMFDGVGGYTPYNPEQGNVPRYNKIGAFENHIELTEVYFTANSKIEVIGRDAFKNCSSLEKIVLPKSIKRIETGAFAGCTSLREVVFDDECEGVTIETGAFKDCTSLRSVTLPAGVTGLEDDAFDGCVALIDVYMKSSTAIVLNGAHPFEYNAGLVIHIPSGAINSYASGWEDYEEYLIAEEE